MSNRVALTRVAATYSAAANRGESPTRAVRERFGISQSTAGAWVSQARAAGLLPPTTPGNPGRRSAKGVKVAKALGIEYEVLVAAIIKHADGDLRVSS